MWKLQAIVNELGARDEAVAVVSEKLEAQQALMAIHMQQVITDGEAYATKTESQYLELSSLIKSYVDVGSNALEAEVKALEERWLR